MKAAWIFPINKRCGISFYSHAYCRALSAGINLQTVDPGDYLRRRSAMMDMLNDCDLVHIQYEPSLFMDGNRDFFARLCARIKRPLVVSLHELYEEQPGVYPRSAIRGTGLLRFVKLLRYDLLHPAQTARRRHELNGFYADTIVVHAQFQRDILVRKGIDAPRVRIIPYPVQDRAVAGLDALPANPVRLAALGFINPLYDYHLLLQSLSEITVPWQFTWIGGLRRNEDAALLDKIEKEINARGWSDRFIISGWVSDSRRDELLSQAHIVLAIFQARSSSESLATALSARKLIIATALPFINELVAAWPMLDVTEPKPRAIAASIERLLIDPLQRRRRFETIDGYIRANRYEVAAAKVIELYRELVGP